MAEWMQLFYKLRNDKPKKKCQRTVLRVIIEAGAICINVKYKRM